ncbi:hypothetical protein [Halorubrum vacuolatum]|nr:hypothetical protein [Halorubrum vacuolatum]
MFRTGIRAHRGLGFARYTDADPFKYIYVDPNAVEYYYSGPPRGWGRVVGGTWDLERTPLEEHPFFVAVEEHYRQDIEWKHTELWELYQQRDLPEGEFHDAVERIEAVYESIKKNGYRSQTELLRMNPQDTVRRNNDAIHPSLNEIAVNIFRDGSLGKKYSGTHRLAIARVLDIEKVPMLVRTRHAAWQRIRSTVRRSSDVPEEISEAHPDLQDLLDR